MISELCIRRPVMTILLIVSFLAAGMFEIGRAHV